MRPRSSCWIFLESLRAAAEGKGARHQACLQVLPFLARSHSISSETILACLMGCVFRAKVMHPCSPTVQTAPSRGSFHLRHTPDEA